MRADALAFAWDGMAVDGHRVLVLEVPAALAGEPFEFQDPGQWAAVFERVRLEALGIHPGQEAGRDFDPFSPWVSLP